MGHAANRKFPFQKDFLPRLRGFPIVQNNQSCARTATAAKILIDHVAVRRRRLFINQQVVERQRRMLEENFAAQGAKLFDKRGPIAFRL